MVGKFDYTVVRVEDRHRGERLNAGIAILKPDGLDIRLPRRLERLRALSGALDIGNVRANLEKLSDLDDFARATAGSDVEQRLDLIGSLTAFSFSPIGSFIAHNTATYESGISRLIRILVEPELPPVRMTQKRTHLSSALKAALRGERVLARKGEGLSAHRVVSNVQIAEGLSADFVLKNGAMHVIETVDASSEDISLKKVIANIAVSALVLEQARMIFGSIETKGRLVYNTSSSMEKLTIPSLEAVAHQGADLINWSSLDDRNRLITDLSKLAEPLPTKREEKFVSLHASTQSKFLLN
ncbi:DUF3037 domain-containing protein [Novosphingobium sp. EMRT-2]|uniref:DUF3037 domain-containing protein n=1 Tax=Novosphingobium sp. EMRT-2 TaxID=2571749 RepID=UPI0010BDE240|nr:DUF3037 domain-containing protein [Novosphingobium sp. EMRT-2]QCI93789.1 DUF3037 domain-containing protein [Novosphingobium sp. EMRT-2]